MIRSMLTVVLVAALAMSAGAYDVLYSNDTGATHEAGAFGIGGSFLYFAADQWYDENGEAMDGVVSGDVLRRDGTYTGTWFPINIYYGIIDGLDVGATPIFMMDEIDHGDDTTRKGTGIGDTWIWAKYGLLPEPMLTARVGLKLATGEDEPDPDERALGTGQMDIDGAVMFGAPAGPGSLDGSFGYRYRLSKAVEGQTYSDVKPGSEVHFFVGYTYFINDAMSLRLGGDGYFGSDWEYDYGSSASRAFEAEVDSGSSIINVNPGFDYIMDSGVSLGFDMHYPLAGKNINGGWGLGLSVGWGN